ncbi:Hypothetical protein NTJ_15597 [Nesidiocoris tenuis]|uniref:Uncharacterized protein n=1 Tax=Nesidiocoris tenuis TaxID=355587 RepID=A0ABN7BEG9_9HEMI|nr:Hypothetical protein NTJ_15597 [Nesidiocoris tenuis]
MSAETFHEYKKAKREVSFPRAAVSGRLISFCAGTAVKKHAKLFKKLKNPGGNYVMIDSARLEPSSDE